MTTKLSRKLDTIVAQVTPAGRGAVGVVRLSGDGAFQIAKKLASRWEGVANRAQLVDLTDHHGVMIDRALVLGFKAPASLTGEDVVEFQCHGNPLILQTIIESCLALAARSAEPGEFLRRAFECGKYDLTQIEAIGQLIQAQTRQGLSYSLNVTKGVLNEHVSAFLHEISSIRVLIESSFEFSDVDDIQIIEDFSIKNRLDRLIEKMEASIRHSQQQLKWLQGVRLCVIGPPNAGKSSLLNYLAKEELAIVHDQPGTTRDYIKGHIDIKGLPFTIVDTAGLRSTECAIERAGIERSAQQAKVADVLVYLTPSAGDIPHHDQMLLDGFAGPKIFVQNKIDLASLLPYSQLREGFDVQLGVSVSHQKGLDLLENKLVELFSKEDQESLFGAVSQRQLNIFIELLEILRKSRHTLSLVEICAEHLREAAEKIGELTGSVTTDDLLGQIFSTFCIGK